MRLPTPAARSAAASWRIAILGGLLQALGTAPPAAAEWFFDLYGGGGFIERTDVSIASRVVLPDALGLPIDVPARASLKARATLRDVESENFPTGGIRVGYWFERFPQIGLALDASMFHVATPRQTVLADADATLEVELDDRTFRVDDGSRVAVPLPGFDFPRTAIATTPMLMARWPLWPTADVPHGRVQPYVNLGPALLFTDRVTSPTVGVQTGAGLAWQFHRRWALFGEYRFFYAEPTVRTGRVTLLSVDEVRVRTRRPEVEAELRTHLLLTGLSFRW